MPYDPLAPGVANQPLTTEQQEGHLTDAEGKISPATFPVPTASPDFISTMAGNLRSSGEAISDSGADIKSSWGGLTSCYEAPHQEELYEVLDPVASDGNRVMYGINRMTNALEDFAEALSSIKTRWSSLRTDSYEFLSRIAEEGDDWDDGVGFLWLSENPNVAENRALYERGVGLIEEYEEAERDCANRINANVENRTRFESMPSDGELDDDVFYHGYEDDLSDLATEWDSGPAGTDLPWWGDAGVAVWDFGVGAVEGTGAMLGMHSSQGWFNMSWGDALYEYHEDNIQSTLGLVGLYDAESDSYGWSGWDNVGSAWKDLAHSVVPWEEWGERPGYVIGTALLNIGGTVGGAALSATGVGATVGVPLMAWRGASILDGMGSGRGPGGGGVDLDLSGTTARVSNTHMQAIQAYMDQLVNPNYTNISGASDIDLGDLAGEGSGRRSNTQQNQDSPENNPAPRRTGEEADPRTEELQAFEQIMDNNPDLKRTLEEGEPALGEHDPVSLELGDGSWEGAPGDGRRPVPVGADRPSDSLAAGNDFGNAQDNRYDLSSAEDPSSVAPRGNSTSVTDRAPHTVLNQDGGGAGRGGSTRHESFDQGQGPRNDSLQDGGSDQRSHSSEGSGSGNGADTYDTSSGGSGGSSNGPRSGQDVDLTGTEGGRSNTVSGTSSGLSGNRHDVSVQDQRVPVTNRADSTTGVTGSDIHGSRSSSGNTHTGSTDNGSSSTQTSSETENHQGRQDEPLLSPGDDTPVGHSSGPDDTPGSEGRGNNEDLGGTEDKKDWRSKDKSEMTPEELEKREKFLTDVNRGTLFNKEREPYYTEKGGVNELYVGKITESGGYQSVDSYIPQSEIVSRKHTQFSEIELSTGRSYINELNLKYSPGTDIPDLPSTREKLGIENVGEGNKLKGEMILEVPQQKSPVPEEVLELAEDLDIIIRDVDGRIYSTDNPAGDIIDASREIKSTIIHPTTPRGK